MADSMDLVRQRIEENLQRHLQNARARKPGIARVLCIDCDSPIPEARRQATLGIQRCVTYQEIAQLKGKHYTRGAL